MISEIDADACAYLHFRAADCHPFEELANDLVNVETVELLATLKAVLWVRDLIVGSCLVAEIEPFASIAAALTSIVELEVPLHFADCVAFGSYLIIIKHSNTDNNKILVKFFNFEYFY